MEGTLDLVHIFSYEFIFSSIEGFLPTSVSAEASVRLQNAAADLLSEIKGGCKTSQKAIDNIVKGTNRLFNIYLEVLKVTFQL